jgi:hypothetical protein
MIYSTILYLLLTLESWYLPSVFCHYLPLDLAPLETRTINFEVKLTKKRIKIISYYCKFARNQIRIFSNAETELISHIF